MRPVLLGLATASLASLSAPIFAQTAPAAETTGEAGDIIVTAQLREQNSIDVPVAVSALTGAELDRFGLSEFEEVGRFIPGFDVQNQSPNNPGFVIRGITSDSGTAFNEPRVSVFQDGVSISKSRGSYVELFDMERVEVAKGPQSTLYGRGALIGAVNLVQNKADPKDFAAYASGSYGNFNAWTAEAMANAPLGEGVALRVAGRIRKADGYVKNLLDRDRDFNSDDTRAVRGAFHAETGGLTFDVIGNYQKDDPTGTSFKSIAYRPTDPATGTVIGTADRNSGAALVAGSGFENGTPLGLDREVWGVTGIANLAMGNGFTLTSISAYRRFDALEIFDADGLSLPILTAAEDARGRQTSQELRLRYDDDRLSAFVGASYFHETGSQRTPAQFDERMALARLTGALNGGGAIPGRLATDPAPAALFGSTAFTSQLLRGAAAASGVALSAAQATAIAANLKSNHLETSTNSSRTNAFDIFGDATFKVSDQFEVGAGLRWSHDDKTSRIAASLVNGRSILGSFIAALGQPAAARTALLGALSVPGAATIPPSTAFPVPLIGLGLQPTAGNGGTDSASLKDDGFSWRLTARYSPTDDASIYANYARGRRPRVLAASTPSSPFGASRFVDLPNETVDSYEVGAKGAFLNRKLMLDGSVFYYEYKNFQTTVQQGTLFVTTNAGRAETYGLEGDMRYVPNDTIALIATYAYNHSRFKTGVRDGNRLRLSPDHSASIGAIIGVPVGPGRVTFTPSLTWQSKVFFDDDNDRPDLQQTANGALVADNIQDEVQKGYALANARIGYELDSGFQIEAYVDNLFDKKYIKDAGNTGDGLGLPTFIGGEPRFYGVRISYRFGGKK